MNDREEWEKRVAANKATLDPYVDRSRPLGVIANLSGVIDEISVDAYGLQKVGKLEDSWSFEVLGGTDVTHAMQLAWKLNCITSEPVSISFNGTKISIENNNT